jgi:signal transduction histidine kinase
VVLDVDDDGAGVPAADRARVFERFVRLDDARARDEGGSGLGLAIVAQLVTAHGGDVEILDSPLGGARVEVRLPGFDSGAQRTPATRIASSARSTVSATARAS